MYTSILLIASLCFATVASATVVSESTFRSWMLEHGRTYSDFEFLKRYRNFQANQDVIESGKFGGVYGHNKFSDLSEDEFRSSILMTPFDATSSCIWPFSAEKTAPPAPTVTSFDWRTQTQNVVTPVKDQGQCGSCWSFSTTGTIESAWSLAGNDLVSLSEQNLVDCSSSCLVSHPTLCNDGCNGGLPWLAMNDIISVGGVDADTDYPYQGVQGTCTSSSNTYAAKISKWVGVDFDVDAIKAALIAQGTLSVTLNANPLMSYQSGVITGQPQSCDNNGSDHAVLLVGFGTDSGVDYWTVKNSWGSSWGEDGYFRIQTSASTTENFCGVQSCVTYTTV